MEKNQTNRTHYRENKEELLLRITGFLRENLTRKMTLRQISSQFDVSVSTITQMFQKCANTTFHSYLTGLRMAEAEDLIRTGTPLEEVGRRVGYSDHSTFYRAFCQTFGKSPREYRKAITE